MGERQHSQHHHIELVIKKSTTNFSSTFSLHSFVMKLISAASAILLLLRVSSANGQDATFEPGNFSEGVQVAQ